MMALRQFVGIAVVALVFSVGSAFWNPRVSELLRPGVELSLIETRSLDSPLLWVDARVADDYEAGHYPDAVLLNEEDWEMLLPEFLGIWTPDATVIVYCSSRSCPRSREVAIRLRSELGVENVFSFEGGWEVLSKSEEVE